jgi:hypothetical protein
MARGTPCALACVLLLAASAGCATGRGADLQDTGRLSLGIGIGIAADAKLGALTHPAIGTRTASAMFGFDSRFVDGAFYQVGAYEPVATFWAMRSGSSVGPAINMTGWRAAFEARAYGDAFSTVGVPVAQERPDRLARAVVDEKLKGTFEEGRWLPLPPELTFRSSTDLQLGFTLLIVSGRVGFNVLELFDFLLGFGGLDIAGDDARE